MGQMGVGMPGYGGINTPMGYPPNLSPEIVHQLKALGTDERPYFEKVCYLQQYIEFLNNVLQKNAADQAMASRINTMLSVIRFERFFCFKK